MNSTAPDNCVWIADDAALAAAAPGWRGCIALDTEFIRTDTFYPVPGLYQVACAGKVYLLDPLAIDDWSPFVDVLADSGVDKIMHACQEDLELIYHHLGIVPAPIFDTQYANAFISPDFSLSYAGLVQRLLDVELPKHATRSNWLLRPLSDEQLQYAREDVVYLEPLYQRLQQQLRDSGREAWFQHDMQERGHYAPSDPQLHYLNLKKAWQLAPQQLAVLQTLCAWREQTAQTRNIPRNRVVWDDHLFDFARIRKLREEDVRRALPRGVANRYAEPLVSEHSRGRTAQPPAPLARPLTSAQGAVVKRLREIGRQHTERLQIAAELLARKRDVEECVRYYVRNDRLSPLYQSWRQELVGGEFSRILATHAATATQEQL